MRLKVVLTGQDTVDSGNAAVAAASCTDCTTVALAIEGVVVWGEPETVVPVNLALALNTECDSCQTLAAAYQYVTSVDSRVRITGEGRRTIASLRQQLNSLRTSDLDILQVKAEADRIAGEFYQVLKSEVVPIGQPRGAFPEPGSTPTPFTEDTPAGTGAGTSATEEPATSESTNPSNSDSSGAESGSETTGSAPDADSSASSSPSGSVSPSPTSSP